VPCLERAQPPLYAIVAPTNQGMVVRMRRTDRVRANDGHRRARGSHDDDADDGDRDDTRRDGDEQKRGSCRRRRSRAIALRPDRQVGTGRGEALDRQRREAAEEVFEDHGITATNPAR